jgi:hypothetical protein
VNKFLLRMFEEKHRNSEFDEEFLTDRAVPTTLLRVVYSSWDGQFDGSLVATRGNEINYCRVTNAEKEKRFNSLSHFPLDTVRSDVNWVRVSAMSKGKASIKLVGRARETCRKSWTPDNTPVATFYVFLSGLGNIYERTLLFIRQSHPTLALRWLPMLR